MHSVIQKDLPSNLLNLMHQGKLLACAAAQKPKQKNTAQKAAWPRRAPWPAAVIARGGDVLAGPAPRDSKTLHELGTWIRQTCQGTTPDFFPKAENQTLWVFGMGIRLVVTRACVEVKTGENCDLCIELEKACPPSDKSGPPVKEGPGVLSPLQGVCPGAPKELINQRQTLKTSFP